MRLCLAQKAIAVVESPDGDERCGDYEDTYTMQEMWQRLSFHLRWTKKIVDFIDHLFLVTLWTCFVQTPLCPIPSDMRRVFYAYMRPLLRLTCFCSWLDSYFLPWLHWPCSSSLLLFFSPYFFIYAWRFACLSQLSHIYGLMSRYTEVYVLLAGCRSHSLKVFFYLRLTLCMPFATIAYLWLDVAVHGSICITSRLS